VYKQVVTVLDYLYKCGDLISAYSVSAMELSGLTTLRSCILGMYRRLWCITQTMKCMFRLTLS
jgi:hypothetical protein